MRQCHDCGTSRKDKLRTLRSVTYCVACRPPITPTTAGTTHYQLRVTETCDPYAVSDQPEQPPDTPKDLAALDPVTWAKYIDDGLQLGKQWDRISEMPPPIRAIIEISRRIGTNPALPHVLRGDEGPRHLDPKYIARLFNCHFTVASRLTELFTTFELSKPQIQQFATTTNEYGGPLGLAFYLETLALKADLHPALETEQPLILTQLPDNTEHSMEDDMFGGQYEPIAYHKLDPIEDTPIICTVLPKWVSSAPEWARQLIATLDHSPERAYQAANLMRQRATELDSSARQWIWKLIRDRIAALTLTPPTSSPTEPIKDTPTIRTAWPQWVSTLPEWARQLIATLDHTRERAYQAANLMGQRGSELNSSARQWIWNLIKDRIVAHKPAVAKSPPTESYDFRVQTALIERADTQERLNELALYIKSMPEQIKAPLRELWIKRRDALSSPQVAV